MTIKGLTDRHATFPEIGSIRKGRKETRTKNGKEYEVPVDLKYFRIELDAQETKAAEIIKSVYKDEPTELNILFPFDDIDRNFECWLEGYVGGTMVYRSDGERILFEMDPATGERLVVNGTPEKPHRQNPIGFYTSSSNKKEPINFKPTGRMKVIIPELARLCYLTVHTTSVHDVINLTAQLRALQAIHGRLAGIPLKLRRRPLKISTPSGENGKRARREKWLLSVEADPEWVAAKIAEMKRAALPAPEISALLPPAPATPEATPGVATAGPAWSDEFDDEDEIPEGEITGGDAKPAQNSAPAAPSKPAASKPAKPCDIKCQMVLWNQLCAGIAETFAAYKNGGGKPNYLKIQWELADIGYSVVDNNNVEVAFEELGRKAQQQGHGAEPVPATEQPEIPF